MDALFGNPTPDHGRTPMNTTDLLNALRDHYIKPGDTRPGCAFLTEVTAPNRANRADAIHVGMWASRGYTVDVHELKISRADFQRELDKPAKAEAWWPHSNTFWIVAPHETIAPPEMLPAGWGLMVPGGRGRKFKKIVEAEFRPLQPSTALLAALLVSMETDRNNALEAQRQRLGERHYAEVQAIKREVGYRRDPATVQRLELMDRLEKLAGFRLTDWDYGTSATPETWAEAIRNALTEYRASQQISETLAALDAQADRMKQAAAEIRAALANQAPIPA
jgi:hypothetical protein